MSHTHEPSDVAFKDSGVTLPTVSVVTTGGAIGMESDPATGALFPTASGAEFVNGLPHLTDVGKINVDNFSNIPSAHMTPEYWCRLGAHIQQLVDSDDITGVVVTLGTDTMEETAFFLDLTIKTEKPVVLTGSNRDLSHMQYDGHANLVDAIRVATDRDGCGVGVVIVFQSQIHAAREATKVHTMNLACFHSGPHGSLGVVDPDRVVWYRKPARRQYLSPSQIDTAVDLVTFYAGADGRQVDVAIVANSSGLVVQALGSGNVNQEFYFALKRARDAGIAVVVSSRVPAGRVLPKFGFEGGGATLKTLGAVFADDLSPQKARVLLMLALGHSLRPDDLQAIFDR